MGSELPEGWKFYKLGHLAEYINGRAFKPTEWEKTGLPILRIQNLTKSTTKVNYFSGEFEKRHHVINEDILLAWSATLDIFWWTDGEAVLNQHIFKVLPNEKIINKRFYFYLIKNTLIEIRSKTHGTGMTHITKPTLLNISVPVPPLLIQKKIVAILDNFFREYELLKIERKIAQKNHETIMQGVIEKLIEFEGADKKKMGEVCIINPSKKELQLTENSEVSFIPMKAVSDVRGEIIENWTEKLGKVRKGYTYFAEGDILFAKITPCMENGKIAIAKNLKNGAGFGTTEFHVLRCKEAVLPDYVYYYLRQKSFRSDARMNMTGTAGQLRVPSDFLRNYKIPVPRIQAQKKIVKILGFVKDCEKEISKKQEEAENQIQNLPHSVLRKAFEGKLIN